MIIEVTQRWRNRRDSYRPAGEVIRTADFEVARIDTDKEARDFVQAHHYSGSYPAARRRFGLYRHGELVGVSVFSVPQNSATFNGLPGEVSESLDLGRFVLLDDVAANAESWFLARCFHQLNDEGFVTVISFSDPSPRTDRSGGTVFMGHVGTIYQALNGRYLGRSKAETKRMLSDGRVIPGRSLTKIRYRRQGHMGVVRELVSYGATPLTDAEDPVLWVRHWLDKLTRPLRHDGNHKYAWGLNRSARRHLPDGRAYPKLADPSVHSPQRGFGFSVEGVRA